MVHYTIPDPVLPQPDMRHSWCDEYGVALFGRQAAVTFSLNVIPVPLYGLSFTKAMSNSNVRSENIKQYCTACDVWTILDDP